MENIFGDVIYSYTREQALEDGVLVDLNKYIPINESGFKYPIACTSSVFAIIKKSVENKNTATDYEGIIWDILNMSKSYLAKKINASTSLFSVIIIGAGRKKKYDFKIICHAGDNLEPVLTIMLPEED